MPTITHRLPQRILLWTVILTLVGAGLFGNSTLRGAVTGEVIAQEIQPTAVPPTVVPPTAIPPTPVPTLPEPTALPTMQPEPTQVPPTPIPTPVEPTPPSPTATPTPEPGQTSLDFDQPPAPDSEPTQPPLNTDSLIPMSGSGPFPLEPSASTSFAFTYLVTTARTVTSLHAELRHADGSLATAWWLQGQAGGSPWSSSGGEIDLSEGTVLIPGTSFAVTLVVTAPAAITQQEDVTLYLRSDASSERGVETAVAESALATFTGIPSASVSSSNEVPALAAVDGGNLNCLQTLPLGSGSIDAGEVTEFSCTYAPGPVRLRVNSLTEHWEYRLGTGSWSTVSGTASLTPASGNGGQPVTYVIQLRFTGTIDQVPPGSTGQVVVEITSPAGNPQNPAAIATLGATRTTVSVPTADDLGITCVPDPVVASAGEATEATCTVIGEDTLAERTVTLTQIAIAAPPGWTVTGDGAVSGTTLTMTVSEVIDAGTEYAFGFFLTPETCATAPGTVAVSSIITFTDSASFQGPSASTHAALAAPPALLPDVEVAALDFGTSVRDGTTYPAVTGVLALTISEPDATGCSSTSPGWSVQVEMSSLHDPETGASIAPDAFTYLGSGSGTGASGWLVPETSDLPLGSGPTTIATGTGNAGSGATWNAVVQLDPPADAQPGSYGGTVSVVIVNAP